MIKGPGKTNKFKSHLLLKTIVLAIVVFLMSSRAMAGEVFKITAYCSCVKCCGKSDGITASGHKVKYGYVACNWLPFHTKIHIKGLGTFIVMDRGAKSLFGSKTNHIKHLDVYLPTHQEARNFGVKYLEVEVLK